MNRHVITGIFLISHFTLAYAESTEMTDRQKFSYALGAFFSQSIMQQTLDLDNDYFLMAVEDRLSGDEPKLTAEEMQSIFAKFQQQEKKKRTSEADRNRQAGKDFLENNKSREGIVVLDNGLQYEILKAGGGESPSANSEVTVHYKGTHINGKEFDSSYARNEPARLSLDRVIKGWQLGVPLMKAGAKWRLYIPPALAYGNNGQGTIGPDETLIFDIELLAIH